VIPLGDFSGELGIEQSGAADYQRYGGYYDTETGPQGESPCPTDLSTIS
jgi:hypothetical protein